MRWVAGPGKSTWSSCTASLLSFKARWSGCCSERWCVRVTVKRHRFIFWWLSPAGNGMAGGTQSEAQQTGKDCLACRVTGTLVCCGVGGYLALHTYAKPPPSPIQRVVTFGLAGVLCAMGVARALM